MNKWNGWKWVILVIICIVLFMLGYLSLSYVKSKNGDMTTMLAGLWSAGATAILGGIAIWQNMRYKKLADIKDSRYLKIENEKMRLLNLPYFSINTGPVDDILLKDNGGNYIKLPDDPQVAAVDNKKAIVVYVSDESIVFISGYPGHCAGIKPHEHEHVAICYAKNCGNNTANSVRISAKLNGQFVHYPFIESYAKNEGKGFYFAFNVSTEAVDISLVFTYYDIFRNKYEQTVDVKYVKTFDEKTKTYGQVVRYPLLLKQTWVEKAEIFVFNSNENTKGDH